MNKINELEKQLRAASEAYYNSDQSILSDQEFDSLRDELIKLDPNNSFLKEVGSVVTSPFTKINHVIPMGSLDKMNTEKEFNTWLTTLSKTVIAENDRDMILQWKLDGISIELVFHNGKFVQAITRGDGKVGDDVTHTIKNAKGFPHNIKTDNEYVYVRCEAVLMLNTWKTEFSGITANPRNAVAGLVRRTDAIGSKHITCIAFDVELSDTNILTEHEKIEWLKELGFNTVNTKFILGKDINNLPNMFNKMLDRRAEIPYEVDGAVIKIDNLLQQNELGERESRPKWARAWKFPAIGGHTTLLDVEWFVGTQGTITPVAKVKPVNVGGTTIQNVTLHNADEIDRLGVCIGDIVEVVRAGDVIPRLLRVVTPGANRKNILISKCPSCGSSVNRVGPRIVCSNDGCEGSAYKRIDKWITNRNIMFLGDKALEVLVDAGIVSSISSIYHLNEQIMVNAGLGQRMSQKILEEIEKSRDIELSDFLGSLSIDMLGRREASNLIEAGFDNLDKFNKLTINDLLKLDGYQETKANRVYDGIQKKWNEIVELSKCLKILKPQKFISGCLNGLSFCFTGTMDHPRKELEDTVEKNGGKVSSVNKGLSYLVIADINSDSSKAVKARKLGIKLISENDFLKMIS